MSDLSASKTNTRVGENEGEFSSEVRDIVSFMPLSTSMAALERPSHPSTITSLDQSKPSMPEPLGLSSAQGCQDAGFALALATARFIEDLNEVPYPEGARPNPDFNFAVTPRRFRYNREFMFKFANVCKGRPGALVPVAILQKFGLDPATGTESRTGARHIGRRATGRMSSQSKGLMNPGPNPVSAQGRFVVGDFQGPSPPSGDSQSRYETSISAHARTPSTTQGVSRKNAGGGPREPKRTRSQRGRNRAKKAEEDGSQASLNQQASVSLGPIKPLEQSENRWVATSTLSTPQQLGTHALVEHKVRALLNKITMDKFDSISDQIVDWTNNLEQEKDGSPLKQVVKLILRGVKEEAAFSEMYARLCRKMMERISPNVQDETTRNAEGKPITGGMLFRKHLLNQCQEFEHESSGKKTASDVGGQAVPRWGGPWSMLGAGRQGLGLACFTGELFKLQMLTERIMHEYIKRLLSKIVNPKEEAIESLCKLLTTVGKSLDNPKARKHVDVYFDRMQEMTKGSNIESRLRFMIVDVIELRAREWQARSTGTIASIAGASLQGRSVRNRVQRGGSRRGEHRDTPEPDGWNVAGGATTRPQVRAGDLSQFGKISKPTGIQFGPSSVFSKKDPKREAGLARAGGANAFSALPGTNRPLPPPEHMPRPGHEEPPVGGAAGSRKLDWSPRKKNASAPSGSLSAEGMGPRSYT